MSDVVTLLDAAHAAVSADPENEALRLRFFERLADGEMVVDKPAIDAVQVHTNGNVVRIEIPGIGQVWIDSLDYNIDGSGLDFVVWRDSAEYICVEPITSPPGKMAKVLTPGESRMLTAEFLLVAPRRS